MICHVTLLCMYSWYWPLQARAANSDPDFTLLNYLSALSSWCPPYMCTFNSTMTLLSTPPGDMSLSSSERRLAHPRRRCSGCLLAVHEAVALRSLSAAPDASAHLPWRQTRAVWGKWWWIFCDGGFSSDAIFGDAFSRFNVVRLVIIMDVYPTWKRMLCCFI